MEKRIVLCADDYGQAPAISAGILALVKAGRLSAVSCMTSAPLWPKQADWLQEYRANIDLGLHFNLTEGLIPVSHLMLKALTRQLDKAVIAAALHAQLDTFEAAMGCLPQFIDGHQHVHQFPVVRDALLAVFRERLQGRGIYIRVINHPIKFSLKKMVVRGMGTRSLTQQLQEANIPHNQSFSGMYDFGDQTAYAALFPQFLQEVHDGGLIMCHPGLAAKNPLDPIASARANEYAYFISDQFLADCQAANVVIGRFISDQSA